MVHFSVQHIIVRAANTTEDRKENLQMDPVICSGKTAPTEQTHKTFCRICIAFCGLDVTTKENEIVKIGPDKDHPYSWRGFCSKASNANNLVSHPKRLTRSMKRVGDHYVEATYEEAVADIADRLRKIKAKHGPHSTATYLGNPGASNTLGTMCQGGFMAGVGSANAYYVGSIRTTST